MRFWRVLFAEPSRSRTFFTKIALLVGLILLNTYFSFLLSRWPYIARIALILPWYIAISLLFQYARLLVVHRYLRKNNLRAETRDNFTVASQRLSFALTHIVFFFVLLYLLAIPFSQFFTSISLFAVALVLIFREHIVNFVNGAALMFSPHFRIGDYVRIGDHKGRITDITFQSLALLTDGGDVVYVPNNTVFGREVTNFSEQDKKGVTMEFTVVRESAASRLDELEERLSTAVREAFAGNVDEDSIRLEFDKLEKETVTLRLFVRLSRYTFQDEQRLKRIVGAEVLRF